MNRYEQTFINGKHKTLPAVKLNGKSTDKQYFYSVGKSRMDRVSNEFYGDPTYGWLIMLANPEYGALENNIPDGAIIKIPFPLQSSVQDFHAAINSYYNLYGN